MGLRAKANATMARRRGRYEPFRPWEQQLPVSPELRSLANGGPARRAGERRERLILLAVINHPAILDEDAEQFASADFLSGDLDSLRREIIDIAALGEGLETGQLRDHLIERGKGPELARLESQAERLNSWFVQPSAALRDVRTSLQQMIALHRKTVTLERELKAAEQALAEMPSEANLVHLNEIREELLSSIGEEAAIEGFGEASGRPAGSIA